MAGEPSFRARANAWVYAHRLELCVFTLALLVRLLIISLAPAKEITTYWLGADGGDYVNQAQNMLDGRGFSRSESEPYLPDALHTPLYPATPAATRLLFGSLIPLIVIESFLSSLLPVLGILMARLFVQRRSVLTALGIFLALEPHLIFNTIFFATEGISVILITWGTYELLALGKTERSRHAILAGIAFGLATLARPITTYLPLFLLPLFLYQGYIVSRTRPLLKAFGIFLCMFALLITPWLVRNYIVFDSISMSSASWFNVYTRLATTVRAIDTGDDFYTSYHTSLDDLARKGYITHPPPVEEEEIQHPSFAPVLRNLPPHYSIHPPNSRQCACLLLLHLPAYL